MLKRTCNLGDSVKTSSTPHNVFAMMSTAAGIRNTYVRFLTTTTTEGQAAIMRNYS